MSDSNATTPPALRDAVERVHSFLRADDFPSAYEQLVAIVETFPDFSEAQRLLGGVQFATGDAIGAERTLRRAVKANPDWVPTLTMLGELLFATDRRPEGEQLLLRAVAGRPADPRAARMLAHWYNDLLQPARALSVAAPFCSGADIAPELASQHVTALVALGRGADAVAHYRAVVERFPASFGALQGLALALQATGGHDEVMNVVRRARRHGQPTAALCFAHARSSAVLGDFEGAELALRECIALDPQYSGAHDELARLIWMRSGDVGKATEQIDIALRNRPESDVLWAAKAAVLLGAGDPRGAYACLAPRAERGNAQPALLVRAGFAALEFDSRAALTWANRALHIMPTNATARVLQVAAMLGVGDARGALSACDALREGSPDDQYLIALQTTAWRILGDERYAQLCDYSKMVVSYRLEAPPQWSNLAEFLADVQRSLSQLHDAMRYPLLFQSLRHGTETTGDLTHSADPTLRALFGAFDAPVRDYMQRIGLGANPLQSRNTGSYSFSGGWSVRLQTHGFHENHVHPAGWISSACYIQLPGCVADRKLHQGALAFGEPGILTTPKLSAEYEVQPEVGTLVLFPSYFWHGTVPFASNDTRLTVAFDAVPDRRG